MKSYVKAYVGSTCGRAITRGFSCIGAYMCELRCEERSLVVPHVEAPHAWICTHMSPTRRTNPTSDRLTHVSSHVGGACGVLARCLVLQVAGDGVGEKQSRLEMGVPAHLDGP